MKTCVVDGKKYILVEYEGERNPKDGACSGCAGSDSIAGTDADLCVELGDCGARTVWKEDPCSD